MFNIMTDRWLQRRQRSPWRSTKTMGEKKRPQPGTNHGQMLLVCGVREWRQTGLAPQHTARTRTHAQVTTQHERRSRLAREGTHNTDASHSQCCHNRRLRTGIEWMAAETTMIPGIDARRTDGQTTDRPTDRLNMIIFFFSNTLRTFLSYRRATAITTRTRCSHAVSHFSPRSHNHQ